MMRVTRQLIFLSCLFFWMASTAQAIPDLQIYSPDGYYDTDSETWIIPSYDYELWVVGANLDIFGVKLALAVPLGSGEGRDGSIQIQWLNPALSDYGTDETNVESLVLTEIDTNYTDYRESYADGAPDPATYGFGTGIPLDGNDKALPPGGVFPTDFYEYYVGDFDTTQVVNNYIPGDEFMDTADGMIKKFRVVVTGYEWVDIIAYDHYIKSNNKLQFVKTPYSHDGEFDGTPVPEPNTLFLMVSGLMAVAGIGRKRGR